MTEITEKRDNRNYQLKFRVTEYERRFIKKKAELVGCNKLSVYLRKMAITGVIIRYDSDKMKALERDIIGIKNNINQIAARVNKTGNIYSDDIDEIQRKVDELWQSLKYIQSALRLDKQ